MAACEHCNGVAVPQQSLPPFVSRSEAQFGHFHDAMFARAGFGSDADGDSAQAIIGGDDHRAFTAHGRGEMLVLIKGRAMVLAGGKRGGIGMHRLAGGALGVHEADARANGRVRPTG